ncbi:MAG TPA: hypothetical protein VGA55_02180 [Bacteroidota bacterium]
MDKEKALARNSNSVVQEARRLVLLAGEEAGWADEVLLFFYRLRDNFKVSASTSSFLVGKSFHVLNPIIYELESNPDRIVENREQRLIIEGILRDLVSGAIRCEASRASSE